MVPILGYWKIRGLAQPIRYLLEYVGQGYDEKLYDIGPAPDFDRTSWTNVKFNLDLPLPNLPYYIDGDLKLTQSYAILRHLGRKYDLCGKNEKQVTMVDMLMDHARDMRRGFAMLCYFNYTEEKKKEYLSTLPNIFKPLSEIIGDRPWFTGDKITLADFVMYEEIFVHLSLDPGCLKDFPKLEAFLKRFEELPAIKNFMTSPRHIKSAINMPYAKFHSFPE
ncbi:Glutathione S-transferase Mu 3 [Halocaridina rubra]|uniref:glutathione transferase n=1 Tax=Halocaridina rubra TaxID=373956 RepID=A0AAN8X2G8_HALRR